MTENGLNGRFMKGKGISPSEATKKKISLSNKGRKRTAEQKMKISDSLKGLRLGDKNPSWKGGITKINRRIRKLYQYRQWISDIFTRDDYTCDECEKRGVSLHAHHIKPLSKILKENEIKTIEEAIDCKELWNINNGQTLCIPCHEKTDSYKGKATNY